MRVHLVDGTYELFRAHFSKRPSHTGSDGRDLKATVGVASSLLSLLESEDEAVTHIAVAFDNPIRCFRNDLFADYKTEEGVPPELLAQFDEVEAATRALGIVVWSMDEWEADDALATGAQRFASSKVQARIMSPDKDLGQCIRGTEIVQVDRRQQRLLDETSFIALRQIAPESIPDFLALVGDTADGIPGLPGIGEKSAATILARYRHLEDIPAKSSDWDVVVRGAERISESIRNHRTEALLYRKLATLVFDVPLKEKLEDLQWKGVPRTEYLRWCERVGSEQMKTRPKKWQE